MKHLTSIFKGTISILFTTIAVSANAGINDYTGNYGMSCDSVTRTIGVAFAFGEIKAADGAVILKDADARGVKFSVNYDNCDEFSFDDLDDEKISEIQAASKAKCLETDMPTSGSVKELACTLAANQVKDSLTLTQFPDPQDYITPYVTDSLSLDISCALRFFSWCLQYGTYTTYSFMAGNSNYYHAYINGAGKWLETFALNNVLQKPDLPCKSMRQAVLRGDAALSGSVKTTNNLLDGHTCVVPTPLNPGEAVSVILGMDVAIKQSGAK